VPVHAPPNKHERCRSRTKESLPAGPEQAVARKREEIEAVAVLDIGVTAGVAGGTLAWVLTFSHLSGSATAAHLHVGPPGKAGPVAIPLCGPCKSPDKGSFSGPIGGNAQLLGALLHGGAYVNVHTKLNPGGEIRGQLTATITTGIHDMRRASASPP